MSSPRSSRIAMAFALAAALLAEGAVTSGPAHASAPSLTFANRTNANSGLVNDRVRAVYAVGTTIYAGTEPFSGPGGLSISTDGGASFATRSWPASGLGSNNVEGVFAVENTVYAATDNGLSISSDGGTTFVNRTTGSGLGQNDVYGVYVAGTTVYAATGRGLSISSNGGSSFTNYRTSSGLGDDQVNGVYAVGSTVYAATRGGLSISTNGGTTFTTRTTADGLGNNQVYSVFAVGSTVYAATYGGVSISTNGGTSFTNYTTANGLGSNNAWGVYAVGSTMYAATSGGLSISTNGGTSFTNYTTADGLGDNYVNGVYVIGSTVYAATNGGLSISAPILSSVAANPGNSSASVSWNVESNGGSPLMRIEFALDDTLTIDDSTTNVSGPYTLNGVTNGQTYTVYARAVNAIGTGPWSSASAPFTPQAPAPPPPPRPVPAMTPASQALTGVAGVAVTPTSAFTLQNFTAPVRYSIYPPLPTGLALDPATGIVTGTPAAAYPSTRHWITASTAGGSESASSLLTITVDPARVPSAPLDVTATAGDRSARVSWTAPTDPGTLPISSYEVTASPGGSRCTTTSLSCDVTGLVNGAAYTFTATATSAAGTSLPSASSAPVTPRAVTIMITGSRSGREISVTGSSTGLGTGATLQPWVRFPGDGSAQQGAANILVGSDGTFSWHRRAGKRLWVYVATVDGLAKSNTVAIAARS